MDFRLSFKLAFSLFSWNPKHMRGFNGRRIIMSLLLVPVFVILLVINRLCMLLDHLLFPGFRSQQNKNPVFIVAAPRSATTYLFHLLASQQELFTTFTLWEIIFAPSIIQKFIFSAIIKADKLIGSPIKIIILKIEKILFGNFTHIHKISLALPEEDEAILLWNMSTVYLNFFFPDTNHFDDYFLFDECVDARKQHRVMKYYYRCVQMIIILLTHFLGLLSFSFSVYLLIESTKN